MRMQVPKGKALASQILDAGHVGAHLEQTLNHDHLCFYAEPQPLCVLRPQMSNHAALNEQPCACRTLGPKTSASDILVACSAGV